ncbi:MAG: GFA family protein [Rhodospirillaceae bacterium]|jgi:hypothetical protein
MFARGECLCGDIIISCEEKPIMSGCCHCAECQRETGSAFASLMIFPHHAVTFSGNFLTEYVHTGASGKKVSRRFCSKCGSSVGVWYEVTPDFMVVMAGILKDKLKFNPSFDIYSEEALDWVTFIEGHRVYPRGFGST